MDKNIAWILMWLVLAVTFSTHNKLPTISSVAPGHIFLSALFIHFLHTANRNNQVQLPENFVLHTKA